MKKQSLQTSLVNTLCLCIINNNKKKTFTLLKRNCFKKNPANLNQTDLIGHTPLIKGVMMNAKDVVTKLLDLGADVNKITKYKQLSPLHIAVYNGFPSVAKILLQNGAKVNARSKNGDTPLHSACLKNQMECVRVLVSKRANCKLKNNRGQLAFECTKNVKIIGVLKPLSGIVDDVKRINNKSRYMMWGNSKGPNNNVKKKNFKKNKISWKIISKIGRGSFGDVYLAVDVNTKGLIAIKKIAIDERSSNMEKIEKEIKFYKSLSHKYVIKYLGCEKKTVDLDDFFYIYLEYCSEGSLHDFFRRIESIKKRMYFLQFYLKQVVEGLAYLHSKNIIHRDVKPKNILIHTKNEIKLSDFGSAKELEQTLMTNTMTTSEGTFFFMPPEQLQQKSKRKYKVIPKKLDIWSLGITILNLLVGDSVWPKEAFATPFLLIPYIANLEKEPEISKQIKNECLRDLIKRCLVLDPSKRISAEGILKHKFFLEKLECLDDDDEVAEDDESEDDDDSENENENEEGSTGVKEDNPSSIK